MNRLQGKRIVITGGSGGIGSAAAQLFLTEGASVLLVDLDEARLKETTERLVGRVFYYRADVTNAADVQGYVQAAKEKLGGIDVFFNNAGIEGKVVPLTEYPEDLFRKVLDVNVMGAWLGLKYVMPVMQEHGGGSIIITSSVAGLSGTPNVSAYVTSKHAVVGLMKVAALEGAAHNIRVNTVHPSPVDNRMMRSLEEGFAPGQGTAAQKQFADAIPLKRYAREEDVINLVLFLASDESAFITGGQYTVDGGMAAL
ncbi:SDR family NAD(P)-dependent oxidoreductase [Fibrivirga algicola]|uniref:SDR family oxidoreductase n=1 Tax=Fibrivirga algicola TaxID=2950420 RepID=A0ABX0Q9N3_9BACT|nr:SDR family oxidoreductase [Fibrivirga algicola]NID08569.1 SDR family oxidoreductase [Fibrivirga algicola]